MTKRLMSYMCSRSITTYLYGEVSGSPFENLHGAMVSGVPVMRLSALPVTLALSNEVRIVLPMLTLPSERVAGREYSP